jgi:hypothetical protein
MRQNVVEHHDLPCHQRGTRVPSVATVLLANGAMNRPRRHVVNQSAIRAEDEAYDEAPMI